MPTAFCKGGGQQIEIPAGIKTGEMFDGPNGAGLSLRVSEKNGSWSVTEVKKASCAVGNEMVILPDHVRPGDIIVCHGVRQRVTYEYGAYALVRVDGWRGSGDCWEGGSARAGHWCLRSVAFCPSPSSSWGWAVARSWPRRGNTPHSLSLSV